MPVWCTKRSLPPSSGVMKPKPLSSLNHFTMPVAMMLRKPSTGLFYVLHAEGCLTATTAGAGTAFAEPIARPYGANATNSGGECHAFFDVAAAGGGKAHDRAGRAVGRH